MSRVILITFLFAVASCSFATLPLGLGCASPQAAEANSAYSSQLAGCVASAKTKDAGRACLDQVDDVWGLRDGGGQ